MIKLLSRMVVAAAVWPTFLLTKLALVLVGVPIVTGLIYSGYLDRHGEFPKWAWLWWNDEDGTGPSWWFNRYPDHNERYLEWWWLAIRNPANNMRFLIPEATEWTTLGDPDLHPRKLRENGKRWGWKWTYSGWQDGFVFKWLWNDTHYLRLWWGFKHSGVPGQGVSLQMKLYTRG